MVTSEDDIVENLVRNSILDREIIESGKDAKIAKCFVEIQSV